MKAHLRLFLILSCCLAIGAIASAMNGFLLLFLQIVSLVTLSAVTGVFLYIKRTQGVRKPLTERLARRNFQEDLRNSEERLNLVIEGTNDGIWDWNIPTGKVFWSERAHMLAANGSLGFGDSWEVIKQRLLLEDRDRFETALLVMFPSIWKSGFPCWTANQGICRSVARPNGEPMASRAAWLDPYRM
jgi:hypothetical protein